MRIVLIAALLALAACGQSATPTDTATVSNAQGADADAQVGGDQVQGPFDATSTTAMSITGDMSFSGHDVSFMNGIILQTTHIATQDAFDVAAKNGDSFDDLAPGPDDRVVDLRRVDLQVLNDPPQGGLCGATTPTYVAILRQQQITDVTVAVFAGADAPGPSAQDSQLCATYSYTVQN